MKEFTREELAQYNGQDNTPAYIAYEGKVYDASHSYFWRNGRHWVRHRAGQDQTGDLAQAPHRADLLDRLPVIGVLIPTIERVRAILLTDQGGVLLIKRLRDGLAPYWVAPGGGVEDSDADLHAALRREVMEELGAEITILHPAFTYERAHDDGSISPQMFFVCRLLAYDLTRRSGPEFNGAGRGEYLPDELPLHAERLKQTNIQPEELRDYLVGLC